MTDLIIHIHTHFFTLKWLNHLTFQFFNHSTVTGIYSNDCVKRKYFKIIIMFRKQTNYVL